MPQKSTERYKLTLPIETVGLIEVCTELLSERRMVAHAKSDTINIAIESVMQSVPQQVKMICRFYAARHGKEKTIKIRKEVKAKVLQLAKKHGTSSKGYLEAVMTVFFRASLAALWKQNPQRYLDLRNQYPDLIVIRRTKTLPIKKTKTPTITKRKLNLKKDENQMRHHNYLAEFTEYMQRYGGFDLLTNKNLYLSIHEKPIEGSIGKATDLDLPITENPGRLHLVRLWKRGRGYNMTVIKAEESGDGPSLEPGAVFRLYEIYRNIDWQSAPVINN